MSTSEPIELVPDEISILEWYDGAIRGIAESQGKYYLFTLAAWDPNSGRKDYVLINIDPETSAEMKQLCNWKLGVQPDEEKWSRFDQLYDRYLTHYQGPIYRLTEEPVVNKSFAMTAITRDHLNQLRNYDIEKAIGYRGS